MKNKTATKRYIIYILLLIFFGLGLFIAQYKHDLVPEIIESDDQVENITLEDKTGNDLTEGDIKTSGNNLFNREVNNPSDSEYGRKLMSIVASSSKEIDFYGKVVDQENAPVVGAKIVYQTSGLMNVSEKTSGVVRSDINGIFNIKSNGYHLRINAPEHVDISIAYLPPVHDKASMRTVLDVHADGVGGNNWSTYTKHNPYIFDVWRSEKFEELRHNIGEYGLFGLKADGTVYTLIDSIYIKSTRRKIITLAEGALDDGYVQFSCKRGKDISTGWSVSVTAVDGGIQRSDDFYQNLAPVDDYLPAITENNDSEGVSDRGELRHKQYYFVSHGSQVYGSLKITYKPFAKKSSCHLVVEYKINENGSRNLAERTRGHP